MSQFVDCSERLPTNSGKRYCVLVENMGEQVVTTRLWTGKAWMGGCRPFSSFEKVLKWKDG